MSTVVLLRLGGQRFLKPGNGLLLAAQTLQRHGQVFGRAGQRGVQLQGLYECGLGSLVAARRGERAAVLQKRLRAGRIQPGGGLERIERPGEVVLSPIENAQMNARRRERSIGRDRLLEGLLRVVPSSHLGVDRPDRVFEVGARAGDLLFGFELRKRLIQLAQGGQGAGVAVVKRGVERGLICGLGEANRSLEMRHRFRRFAGLRIRKCKIRFDALVVGFQARRGFQLGNRIGRFAHLEQHRAQRLMRLGDARRELDRLGESLPRYIELACLLRRVPSPERGVGLLQGFLIRGLRCLSRQAESQPSDKHNPIHNPCPHRS